jgi:peroxiredoxin
LKSNSLKGWWLALGLAALLEACSKGLPPATAPTWQLKDPDGKTVKSSDFTGKVVLLDFWATWCAPCRQEVPGFVALQKKYGKEGLQVVGVSVDQDGAQAVRRFGVENRVNYPLLLADERIKAMFGGIEYIPTTFILDRNGKIAHKHVGFVPQSVFEKEIKPLLEQKAEKKD